MALLSMTGQAKAVGLAVGGFTLITWLGIRQLGYRELEQLPALFRLSRRGGAQRAVARLRSRLESAAGLPEVWEALTEAAQELGLDAVTLTLTAAADGPASPWDWRGPQADPARPAWTWTLPLVHAGHALGDITLARTLDRQRLALAPGEIERLADDMSEALGRLLRPEAGVTSAA
jgi:hypothetical protein